MSGLNPRGEYQKRFKKLFDEICARHSRWQVWSDFVELTAISISNAADVVNAKDRAKTYEGTIKKYDRDEQGKFIVMCAEVINALEANQNQDFLGDLFMRLELGNENNGQFFTPYNVGVLTAEMTAKKVSGDSISKAGWISVNDPACGAGALLIAFANALLNKGINYQNSVLFVAQDIDSVAAHMCYIQLSLLGCAGYVVRRDTLKSPVTHSSGSLLFPDDQGDVWYTPMLMMGTWAERRMIVRMDHLLRPSEHEVEEQLTLFG